MLKDDLLLVPVLVFILVPPITLRYDSGDMTLQMQNLNILFLTMYFVDLWRETADMTSSTPLVTYVLIATSGIALVAKLGKALADLLGLLCMHANRLRIVTRYYVRVSK